MKLISIVTPCYNEEKNVEKLYKEIKKIFEQLTQYRYEHIFIDNSSTDNTVELLKQIAQKDKNIKIIVNSRNFGHIRSPYYGLLQAKGDAIVLMASDFQDPPYIINNFIEKWENGYKIVLGIKSKSKTNRIMFLIRKLYYSVIDKFSEVSQIKNFTGFGLYDKEVIKNLKKFKSPYPYFRGLISEIGLQKAEIEFTQPKRLHGKTKNNFFTLYDMAMTGFVNHTTLPLRFAVFIGFIVAIISFIAGLIYLIYKLYFWYTFEAGMAPIVIGLFFFSSVQLIFIGIIGEYIGAIYTQVKNHPLVIEKERINFDDND